MDTVSIEIDKGQLLNVIIQLDVDYKLLIFNELKKNLFLQRFNSLLKSTGTDELSFDEITREVETVRNERYKNGRQVH
ncbi:MAG: hypothetical protein RO257_15770 [Candidatus Kapabacteria bacterium]|jgi:hypothetical protein|nr:hypothetical protein [Candidatus Kapabacteria bacterium]